MHGSRLRHLPITLFIAVLCLAAAVTIALIYQSIESRIYEQASGELTYDKTIIIDPGHGGPDGGAVGVDGSIEKNINLSISLKLRSFFLASGFKVIMTRQDDRTICDKSCKTIRSMKSSDLHNRLSIINKHPKALFISIHQNIYSDGKYSGAQVFYTPNNQDGKILAQLLQSGIHDMIQPSNQREIKQAQKNLFIIYYAKSPAVMVECGFMSNPNECRLLNSDDYQNKLAFSVYNGVIKFYSEIS